VSEVPVSSVVRMGGWAPRWRRALLETTTQVRTVVRRAGRAHAPQGVAVWSARLPGAMKSRSVRRLRLQRAAPGRARGVAHRRPGVGRGHTPFPSG